MEPDELRALDELRLRHAILLVEEGIVDVPDWSPALIDDRFGPMPIVGCSQHEQATYMYVGLTQLTELRTSSLRLVAISRNGVVAPTGGFTEYQAAIVADLIEELRSLLTDEELEGWTAR